MPVKVNTFCGKIKQNQIGDITYYTYTTQTGADVYNGNTLPDAVNHFVKYGLTDIRLHDLRHSCASYMLKMGYSMKEISDWLGHADIKTSMNIYAFDMDAKKDIVNRFGSILPL